MISIWKDAIIPGSTPEQLFSLKKTLEIFSPEAHDEVKAGKPARFETMLLNVVNAALKKAREVSVSWVRLTVATSSRRTARPDPADKRFKQLKATELSRQHRAEVHRHLIAQEETMLAGFTPEETEQLRGLLKRLLHNLEGCPVSSAEDIKTHTNGGDAHA